MIIGTKLRGLREQRGMSQGDLEKRTGLLRCYISRIENGHTVPSLETLERFAAALEVPFYKLFYSTDESAAFGESVKSRSLAELVEQSEEQSEDARFLMQITRALPQLGDTDREVLLDLARKLATH